MLKSHPSSDLIKLRELWTMFTGTNSMIQGLSGTVSSFVDDTRVKKSINNADTGAECQELEDDLQVIYEWADKVGLKFNSKKFECLGYRPTRNTSDHTYQSPIEEKSSLRDLDVQLSADCTSSIHIDQVVTSNQSY